MSLPGGFSPVPLQPGEPILANRPGDPGWALKVPPPAKLSSVAVEETPEGLILPRPIGELGAAALEIDPVAVTAAHPVGSPGQRVGIYCGRGESFVVCVEKAPNWDSEKSWKLDRDDVIRLLPILQQLGVNIQDKTGGELDGDDEDAKPRRKAASAHKANPRRGQVDRTAGLSAIRTSSNSA